MVEMLKVMHIWRMEVPRGVSSVTSDGTSIFSWDTTVVETKIVYIIFLTLNLKFSESHFSIRSSLWSLSWAQTSLISLISLVFHIKFLVDSWIIQVWASLSLDIERGS